MTPLFYVLKKLQDLTHRKMSLLSLFKKKVEEAELQAVRDDIRKETVIK